jgi:hypothetical protein
MRMLTFCLLLCSLVSILVFWRYIIHATDKMPLINNTISSVISAEVFGPRNSVLLNKNQIFVHSV